MRIRIGQPLAVRLALVLVAVATIVAIAPSGALAAEAADAIPRTASGRPDLSGTYNTATLTPLVRPASFGERLYLTDEEAEEVARRKAETYAKDYAPSDPDRSAPERGGTEIYDPGLTGAAGKTGGYNAFFLDPGEGSFKIDGKWRTSIITDPPNGRLPESTADAKKRAAEQAAFFHENTGDAWWLERDVGPYDDMELRPLAERCLLGFGSTAGPPMLPSLYNSMKRIVQTEDHVVIVVEMNHDARIIRLNDEHEPGSVRKWLGDSVGHWEGDTLVVDTINFRDQLSFSQASKNLHVVERFTRINEDTLLYQFMVDDPTIWEEPWSGEYPWPASGDLVYEYGCHEGNYALGNIMRGARLLESDALAAQR